ncbi:MAG: MarR family winged helix-turn-helix transcriptional regulator [Acidobacteriia bacterium]|nr:MarR family winged helix-turn-helix transcriptional regulator [Terriglobia bacterium]
MRITKQSVNDLLHHLEQCRYVECRPDPGDKRTRLVCLTSRGRQLDAAICTHARAAERELARELGEKRFQDFYSTLLKISRFSGHAE